ncbi:MDR family MFS transporter [Clostridium coskatii]|uniref:Multidrug export protein EmrB n=1 Tax=Clostridium coskatii TaxID=1705578 RepID=A0A170NP95_9CLOT|nr:MDR family MFS transporter [Clostridium coskatii]OAA94240.1 Multidrug export protein EmrB [Clostridium coskatii]OBR95596.1 multidrug export protein EmrB [Clostridium coskatii]
MEERLEESNYQQRNYNVVPITIALIMAGFLCMLNETLLNMALKNLMVQFSISANTVQWLSTGYMLIMGIAIPVSALLIQSFTTRQLFLTSVTIFLVGTVISGFSTAFSILLVGRLIQAIGTGILIPNIVNTLLIINPIEKRGKALGIFNLVMFCAPAIGPTLSGLIIQSLNWRWLFFIILPFSVISLALGYKYVENVTELTKPPIDFLSIVLSTIGFGGFIYGVSNIGSSYTYLIAAPIIISCIALAIFVLHQLHMSEPMLDMHPFKESMFSLGCILMIIMHMINFATMLILPMFLEGALGLAAFTAGLLMLPGGFINGIISPISGHLYDKFGPKALIIPGYAISTITFFLLSRCISMSITIPVIIVLHCLSLIAVGLINTPVQTNSLNQLSPKYYPHGTAIMNTLQQIAGAFGTSLFVAIMSASQKKYLFAAGNPSNAKSQALSLVFGVKHAFTIETFVLVIALILSLFIANNAISKKSKSSRA